MKKFTKDDLQVNDIVTTRNGNVYVLHKFKGKLFTIREQGYFSFDRYNNDLTFKQNARFDIVKVQRADEVYQLVGGVWIDVPVIWERKEKEKVPLLSEAEYHILNNVRAYYKYITRDKEGNLYLCEKEPIKLHSYWTSELKDVNLNVYRHLFSCIEWEDDKPQKIAELLERYENAQGE